ncbi:class I SAM-dependent methyltransferase [Nocardia sp. BMG51109]|uniref:class I SAM-dependent methyltransferase n=1 Tax=Nocardia sp. BMG51109 TaxID=1056816 RepID=UPI000467BFF3|nr:class I SAM-dependent methyltransferase [Nocardia sp. BMG51109]
MSLKYLASLAVDAAQAGQWVEGSADDGELAYLAGLVRETGAKTVGEIGFNGGFSSHAFLAAGPEVTVCSFDLGEHHYVRPAKEHIDVVFPGRHTLVAGNSTRTVPAFHRLHPTLRFDLIFIDGGHTYEVAAADLANMRAFATEETVVVVDDIAPWVQWGRGPAYAWEDAVADGLVIQDALVKDGVEATTVEPPAERSWVVGRYKL